MPPEQPSGSRLTIAELAAAAGMSIMTVSRVLNHRPDVAPRDPCAGRAPHRGDRVCAQPGSSRAQTRLRGSYRPRGPGPGERLHPRDHPGRRGAAGAGWRAPRALRDPQRGAPRAPMADQDRRRVHRRRDPSAGLRAVGASRRAPPAPHPLCRRRPSPRTRTRRARGGRHELVRRLHGHPVPALSRGKGTLPCHH